MVKADLTILRLVVKHVNLGGEGTCKGMRNSVPVPVLYFVVTVEDRMSPCNKMLRHIDKIS